ncbi:MAG: NAD-glutamate dehydrogenase [Xanthomonadales bacterium]|nr:NAD-glutamate dehydrogenase [Xanthomonadales bacterium]
MSSSGSDKGKQKLLDQVKAILASRSNATRAKQAHYYAEAFFRRVPIEELSRETPAALAAIVSEQIKFISKRPPGEAQISVFNPTPEEDGWESQHTIIEMVNDDMPFLVDTANVVMAELNLGVHLMVHPVIHVERDKQGRVKGFYATSEGKGEPESIIHMQVDRQNDPDALHKIESRLKSAMCDVRRTVEDWRPMLARADEAVEQLPEWAHVVDQDVVRECQEFLSWMRDDHFIFLGARDYEVKRGKDQNTLDLVEGSGLGLLRETDKTIHSRPLGTLSDEARTNRDNPLIITKTRSRSSVHRVGYMDYIGVLRFDRKGRTIGERRFIGLFTSNAYFRRVSDTPLIRLKAKAVLSQSQLRDNSHALKSLVHILETLPRDDLFQATTQEVADIATAVLNLQERQRVRLLIRRERFARFFSCLVYIPRDRFNTETRTRIQKILKRALKGEKLDYIVQISDSVLARLQVIIRPKPGEEPEPDVKALEQKIVEAVRSWHDELKSVLVDKHGEDEGMRLAATIGRAFPAAYIEDVSPWVASFDVAKIAALSDDNDLDMSLYRPRKKDTSIIRFKIFRRSKPIPLSEALPILENMGLHIVSERPYEVNMADGTTVWVQDFDMLFAQGGDLNLDSVRESFQEAFEYILRGITVSDGFNRLILACQLHWRQVKMLRAYCRYQLQTGNPFSLEYMSQTLSRHPLQAYLLVELFDALFNPARDQGSDFQVEQAQKRLRRDFEQLTGEGGISDPVFREYLEEVAVDRGKPRDTQVESIKRAFVRGLGSVTSLDEDRILHSFYSVMLATLRTNFYQVSEDGLVHEYMSFKLDSSQVPDLPKPKPYREIWIYSPRVEGIHLRMGKVARGGLRWSDRKEDFRTEVLGLMKAQNVKNTMIVPVGAKGGFVVQRMPASRDREAVMAEVTYCYTRYINGLLDITDNLDEDKVVHPEQVVRRDEDDPYLVVAADKGTATFSDTANEVAIRRGFWLGDAFASGGSVGYDHKALGITARGAWEGVKRHFRELGINIQKEPFTVVGIGDMSGDVFGNGMLLSKQIRLRAAFNHLHIFLDPNPDEKASFKERQRLFKLPRSNWADYDASLISKGGGVYSRQDKTIPLSKQVRDWLGVEETELAPHELIRELLKSDVDLLWNGGIGTYVKASGESNADVGDMANNSLRVNGCDLRCKVVGEGGNLGLTQRGRIEYAQAGGRLNTDFVDNSAGVDCSDHEVNIKILLNQVMRAGKLEMEDRNALLADMKDEVSDLVLRSNYLQTQAISMMERLSGPRLGAKQHFISVLEQEGQLDRELEALPDDDELLDRRNRGLGLTRPELSVLLSYSKIRLYSQLLSSDIPEDPFFAQELKNYFPVPLRERYADYMPRHRLRRELVATQVTNSLVNRMGVSFVLRMRDDTSATPAEVARAYTIAREMFDARDFWAKVESMDNKVDARLQTEALLVMWTLLRQVTRWLANHPGHELDIIGMLNRLKPGMLEMQKIIVSNLSDEEREQVSNIAAPFTEGGFPKNFAQYIATLHLMAPALDVVSIASERGMDVEAVARVHFGIGEALGLKWFRKHVEALSVEGQWHAHARGILRDELYAHHRQLVDRVLDGAERDEAAQADPVTYWIERHEVDVRRMTDMVQDMRNLANMDYATLSVAVRSLGHMLSATDE